MAALPYVLLYLMLAAGAALMAAYAWRRRFYRSGRPFTLLFGAIAAWCACRVLAILDPTFDGTVFWALLQVGGIVLIMPAWLMVALSYSGQRWRRRLGPVIALLLPAAFSFVVALSNSLHGLWWSRVAPDWSRGFLWLDLAWGPAFWAHSAYAYACFAISVGLLAHTARRAPPAERRPAWLMLGASAVPVVGNLAFLAGLRPPWADDPTPILLFLGALLAFYATVHFRVVDLSHLVEREALLALPDGMIVLDSRHAVVEINDEAARLLGVPARDSAGQPFAALLVGSALGAALRPTLGGLSAPHTHHARFDGPAGQRTVEVRTRPLMAGNGAVSGALILLRDVSERTLAEQAQAQHLAELSLINRVARAANTAADAAGLVRAAAQTIAAAGLWERVAVGLLGPDGDRLTIVADISVDGGGASLEGLPIEGAAGRDLIAMLRAARSALLDLDDPAVAGTPLGEGIAAEGLRRLLVVPLYHQGAPLGLLALGNLEAAPLSPALPRVAETIGELITDAVVRARLYDESRQAERLKASFLASVSHELRTPLTSIIGYVEMLQRGGYGPPPERMVEPLGFMRQSSATLLAMINDILDFSRAEAGHLQLELAPVDLLHVVANVVGQLRPQIAERGLAFELDVPPGLPLALANQARLEQVLANLLGNALKFTDRGRVAVRVAHHGERLRLVVEDTGVGIAPEHLGLIFQEFRRVELPGRRAGGTGLGLAITRRLVGPVGGRCEGASAVGVGPTFAVERAAAERPAAPTAGDTALVGGGARSA